MQGVVVTLSGPTRLVTFKDRTLWTFDSNGRLISQSDRNGNTVTITRDTQGRVTQITEPAGRQLTFSYTGTNLQIDRVSDPLGRPVAYTYDGSGRLASVTDPAGGVTTYTYDAPGRLVTITDPRNIPFLTNEYDGPGRVCRQTLPDGGRFVFYYIPADAAGTGPAQTLLAQAAAGGAISQAPCTVLGTASAVFATVVVDPRGNPATHRFNSNGYLIARTDALGQTTTFDRAPGTNLLLSTTDPLGRVTRFAYDAQGNVTTITDPLGNLRTFTYEPTFNKVTSITNPLGNVTRFSYDSNGNVTATTDPLGNTTQITYNGFGQPVSTRDPMGNTTTVAYNAQGDVVTITDPLGNATTREYDLVSRLLRQVDPRGQPTAFDYDPLNRLTSIVDALGEATAFGYDPNGNRLTVTEARGNGTTHAYDAMDRLVRRTDPLGAPETFSYDPNGNLVTTTDRKGQVTTFTYDALNRRVQSSFTDGAVATFTYDAAGRLLQADDTADPHRPIALTYDSLDRLLGETTALGSVSYDYDALGRRTQMTVSGQPPVGYTYDAASRLRTIAQAPLNPADLQYDALGRRTRLTLPNGVSTEYQYDPASRLTALTYRNGAGVLGDLTYQYDAAGNRAAVGGSFARTLHPDPVPSATYDAANQQLTFGGKSMAYDPNGNLLSLTEAAQTTSFTWDARNRLAALSGATTGSFAYDAQGRRARRDIGGELHEYQYDAVDVIQERVAGLDASYLRTLGIDEPLCRIEPGGPVYYLADALSSSVSLAGAAGGIGTTYTYGPFGETAAGGPSSLNSFQFTGRESDAASLYYYRARYYGSHLHRFTSQDPLASPAFMACLSSRGAPVVLAPPPGTQSADLGNLYAYVRNRPTTFGDPSGLGPCEDARASCFAAAHARNTKCRGNVVVLASMCVTGCAPLCLGPQFLPCLALSFTLK